MITKYASLHKISSDMSVGYTPLVSTRCLGVIGTGWILVNEPSILN